MVIVPQLLPDFRLIYFRANATGFSSLYVVVYVVLAAAAAAAAVVLLRKTYSFNVLIIIQENKPAAGDPQQLRGSHLSLSPTISPCTFHLAPSLPSTITRLLLHQTIFPFFSRLAEDILDVKSLSPLLSFLQNNYNTRSDDRINVPNGKI